MSTNDVKRFLLAPLDWGLGHTTRCVPIIRHLQSRGHRVIVAGNAAQQRFLAATFPGIETWELDGYNVKYSSRETGFLLTLLTQIPRLLSVIKAEKQWLNEKMQTHPVDGIISDNRYGLYHATIPSVIITHQLQIQSGMGSFADELVRSQHYSFLQRFGAIWVPDVKGRPNLSGRLGHPVTMPSHTQYLGLLSQFDLQQAQQAGRHLLVLLSGPEPQRSMLSSLLWQQVAAMDLPVVFVEGSDEASVPDVVPQQVRHYKRLTRQELQPILEAADMVICRSGYSTLMDLVALQKKAILIPTPGQTEQEYLGRHLHEEGIFYCVPQKHFQLSHALQEAAAFPYKSLLASDAHNQHQPVIAEWTDRLCRQ